MSKVDIAGLRRLAEGMATGQYVADPSPYHAELLTALLDHVERLERVAAKVAAMPPVEGEWTNGIACLFCDAFEARRENPHAGLEPPGVSDDEHLFHEADLARAAAALEHAPDCAWVEARALAGET